MGYTQRLDDHGIADLFGCCCGLFGATNNPKCGDRHAKLCQDALGFHLVEYLVLSILPTPGTLEERWTRIATPGSPDIDSCLNSRQTRLDTGQRYDAFIDQSLRQILWHGVGERRKHPASSTCLFGCAHKALIRPLPGGGIALVRPWVIQHTQRHVEVVRDKCRERLGQPVFVVPVEHLEIEWIGNHHALVNDRPNALGTLI